MIEAQEFNEIYKTHYSKVHRLCIGYVSGDKCMADELTQECFVKVWEKYHTFKKESEIGTWIYRIAVNTCLMYLRKVKKNAEKFTDQFIDTLDDEQDENEERLSALRFCMKKLNAVAKLIISLTLENVDQKEIAEITGISNENVRVKVHRTKGQLFKCMTSKNY
jgi:RNA polymerase sigma-70 factor (ECF subfamily)